MSLKTLVRDRSPQWIVRSYSAVIWNAFIRPRMRKRGIAGVFEDHYIANAWGNNESRSGDGSTMAATAMIRGLLPSLVEDYAIGSILDIPCGDFNWMSALNLDVDYIGADIVDALIDRNRQFYADDHRTFVRLDLTHDALPLVDLILCRDCLVHLSFAHIKLALDNIRRSGAKYLLATTHPSLAENRDIVTGEWRRVNLQAPPFSLPPPLALLGEACANPLGDDKHLGLWKIDDPDFLRCA